MRIRIALAILSLALAAPAAAQKLYKHVDKDGKVYYTDRPAEAGQKAANLPPVNVQSPEARRQLNNEMYMRQREEAAERAAAQRRHQSVVRREREQQIKEKQKYYEENPGERPRPIRITR